jgi:hypothetical protein
VILAAGVLLIAIVCIAVVGLGATRLLAWSNSRFECFLIAPLFGIALIVVIEYDLVVADAPLRTGSAVMAILFIAALVSLTASAVGQLRKRGAFSQLTTYWGSVSLLGITVVGTIAVQGAAYFVIGPQSYIGAGTRDVWNYDALTAFLMDDKFSTAVAQVGSNPILGIGTYLKNDRIGFNLVQGTFAGVFRTDPALWWGTCSLLGPALVPVALWLSGVRLSVPVIALAGSAFLAGTLPGLAWVHLENDLGSHALVLPFVLAWPPILDHVLRAPTWKRYFGLALLADCAAITYAEFTPILLVLTVITSVWWATGASARWRTTALVIGATCAGVLFTPTFPGRFVSASTSAHALRGGLLTDWPTYARTVEGFTRVWFVPDGTTIAAISLTIIGAVGLLATMIRRPVPLTIGLAALACAAIVPFAVGTGFGYVYYKTLITVTPVIALGLALLATCALDRRMRIIVSGGVIAVSIVAAAMSTRATLLANQRIIGDVDQQGTIRSPQFQAEAQHLANTGGQSVAIVADFNEVALWLAYYARDDTLLVGQDFFGSWLPPGYRVPQFDPSVASVPRDTLVHTAFRPSDPDLGRQVYVLVYDEPRRVGGSFGSPIVLTRGVIQLSVLSQQQENVALSFNATPLTHNNDAGPRLRIGSDELGWSAFGLTDSTTVTYVADFSPGVHSLWISVFSSDGDSGSTPQPDATLVQLSNLVYSRAPA